MAGAESNAVRPPMAVFRTVLTIFFLLPATFVRADSRWKLIYYRQYGNQLNANNRTIENHCFNDNGTKAAGIGVTNLSNSGWAIFGTTDFTGWNRLNPLDPNNCAYDIRICDPSTPTDQSPNFNWQNTLEPWPDYYSYITWWMKVSDDTRVRAFPQKPVYHYDLVDGLNQAGGFTGGCIPTGWVEAPGANSDYRELPTGGWATYQAQTFVVPAGINRIVAASAFLTRGSTPPGPKFTYRATIREGSPTGTQIGPATVSREVFSGEFKEVAVCWPLNGVPVTEGQTYALHLEATDGQGFNVYRTVNNNYPNGSLWHGGTHVAEHDMVAVVVGVGYDASPPHISRNPALLTKSVVRKNNLPNDTFTIANGGGGTLNYTITDNASWLSVDPPGGSSTGETDTISILYGTAGLAIGSYSGTITINATGADNTPQTVVVNLSVTAPPFAPCDFDTDHDVDQEDFGVFQSCYTGPGVNQTDPACSGALLDLDTDVDYEDFARFLACMGGPDIPVDTTCAD